MRVAAAVAGAERLEDVLDVVADSVVAALPPGSLAIGCWDRAAQTLQVLVHAGDLRAGEERRPADDRYPLAEAAVFSRLLHTGKPYFTAVDDPDADPAAVALLRRVGKESNIGVPILVDGKVWGDIWASTSPGAPRFRARHVRFLEAMAAQLAAVIARAARFSDISRVAYEDTLTGLPNRHSMEERLAAALAAPREPSDALTLMVCDVDHLEAINNGRGHQAGDRALRRVADALVAATAPFPGSTVGRLAGDEFGVLLEGFGLDAAREVAGVALRLLREDRDVALSLSCGAALAEPHHDRPEPLLRAADTGQYAAKCWGGGQLCTAEDSPTLGVQQPRGRRANRRGLSERIEQATSTLLASLDASLRDRSTLDRLELVISGFAEVLNGAAWTVSYAEHGSSAIHSISSADDRDSRLRGVRVGMETEQFELREFPLTGQLVAAGSGAFIVDRYDRDADTAERALLTELGYSSVLAAVASDLGSVYLLEIYGDGDTAPLASAALRLELLARAAAGGSAETAKGVRQLDKRTKLLETAGSLGTRLSGLLDPHEIAQVAADELYRELGFPVCAIVRRTADAQVEIVAGRGDAVQRLQLAGWSQPAGLGLMGRAMREREVVVVGDVRAEPDYRLTPETSDTRSEVCAPLWVGSHPWGGIDLHDSRKDAFDEDDARLVRLVAGQVSAALRSAQLYEQLEHAYLGTAEALGAALEAKDSYTASHSRSLTDSADAVGRALGLDDQARRTLRFGAAFHDIGKLAVPESILNKSGPLLPSEREKIEQHTVIGDEILAPIEFLADVRPLVRHGHERWDGCGYPDGLAGEEIPLGARIIFACDALDAMTTDRPYRAALGLDEACAELRRCAGTQFDRAVVDALLEVLADAATPAVT
ncbi:MAG: HD domain-containing phosphohydrolase [Actinomycetota bacterium]